MRNSKLRNQILCAIFTALIAIGAFIRIPVPVVPFTLQFLFTTLAGVLLGSRLGATRLSAGFCHRRLYFRILCGKNRRLLIQKSAAGQCIEPGRCVFVRYGLLLYDQQLLPGNTYCNLAAGVVLFHSGSAGGCRVMRGRCHFRFPACAGDRCESVSYDRKPRITILKNQGSSFL